LSTMADAAPATRMTGAGTARFGKPLCYRCRVGSAAPGMMLAYRVRYAGDYKTTVGSTRFA
jgi:hypothetical protein